jgi:hydroxypyruvate isomerase
MPRLAANISWLYPDRPFLDRFADAARDGFRGVELRSPYEYGVDEIRARLKAYGLVLALFNAPSGDWAKGERGIASIPGREGEFRDGIALALDYARVLGNRKLHVMAGTIAPGEDRAPRHAAYVRNLAWAAGQAAALGIAITIEPINPVDTPDYFLTRQDEAHAVVAEVGAANLQVQLDLYHCQVVEGHLSSHIRRGIAHIGHVQVAGVPGRHEPDGGEIDPAPLFEQLDHLGYGGWVGLEYRPRGDTSRGLKWARPWLDPRYR